MINDFTVLRSGKGTWTFNRLYVPFTTFLRPFDIKRPAPSADRITFQASLEGAKRPGGQLLCDALRLTCVLHDPPADFYDTWLRLVSARKIGGDPVIIVARPESAPSEGYRAHLIMNVGYLGRLHDNYKPTEGIYISKHYYDLCHRLGIDLPPLPVSAPALF